MEYFINLLDYPYIIFFAVSVVLLGLWVLFLLGIDDLLYHSDTMFGVGILAYFVIFVYAITIRNTYITSESLMPNAEIITNYKENISAISFPNKIYLVVPNNTISKIRLCRVTKSVGYVKENNYYLVLTDTTLKYNCKQIKRRK